MKVGVGGYEFNSHGPDKYLETIEQWDLWPESGAQPQPDYIPQQIRQDYLEAYRILNLSPKASATLARRCLQGMIRDFCGIAKGTLFDEIKELKQQVTDGKWPSGVSLESIGAIDRVREIGNIGAHMEKDVNLIVDIDPDEGGLLLQLIESLFKEWYVARHERQKMFAGIHAVADQKKQERLAAPEAKPALPKVESEG